VDLRVFRRDPQADAIVPCEAQGAVFVAGGDGPLIAILDEVSPVGGGKAAVVPAGDDEIADAGIGAVVEVYAGRFDFARREARLPGAALRLVTWRELLAMSRLLCPCA
jgi:hypothetical protein